MATLRATLAVALLLVLVPTDAAARCMCFEPEHVLLAPRGDGVPLNARVWVISNNGELPSPGLVDATGAPVAVDMNAMGLADGQTLLVLTPRELLQPSTEYTVLQTTFTTGTASDTTPPPAPSAISGGWVSEQGSGACPGNCRPSDYWRSTVTSDGAHIIVADADQGGTLDPVAFTGAIAVATSVTKDRPGATTGSSWVQLGEFECAPRNWLPDEPPGSLRFGAFDLAGNFSGWSEPAVIAARAGCQAGRSNDPWPQLFAILLLWRWSRRAAKTVSPRLLRGR